MSAMPQEFMREQKRPAGRRDEVHTRAQKFWLWFALAALAFCWIAEATMCAERGF
jgi:hypothetical protein